jgi:hypothetical protein
MGGLCSLCVVCVVCLWVCVWFVYGCGMGVICVIYVVCIWVWYGCGMGGLFMYMGVVCLHTGFKKYGYVYITYITV